MRGCLGDSRARIEIDVSLTNTHTPFLQENSSHREVIHEEHHLLEEGDSGTHDFFAARRKATTHKSYDKEEVEYV